MHIFEYDSNFNDTEDFVNIKHIHQCKAQVNGIESILGQHQLYQSLESCLKQIDSIVPDERRGRVNVHFVLSSDISFDKYPYSIHAPFMPAYFDNRINTIYSQFKTMPLRSSSLHFKVLTTNEEALNNWMAVNYLNQMNRLKENQNSDDNQQYIKSFVDKNSTIGIIDLGKNKNKTNNGLLLKSNLILI
jgi:hypothetical protein